MTFRNLTLAALAVITVTASSQTTTTTPKKPATTATTHSTTATHPAAAATPACITLPEISPKIPALPPGAPCPRPLYTITTIPAVKLYYVSPSKDPDSPRPSGLSPPASRSSTSTQRSAPDQLALPHKFYTIHYTGYLTDGTKFDSSFDHPGAEPITIHYGQHQVIPGWDTGFDGMRVGGKRRLFIPYQLAYGAAGRSPIPPSAELIFDVELLSQSDTPPAPKRSSSRHQQHQPRTPAKPAAASTRQA